MPTISIIVPVYKVEKYLPACIRSILRQTYRDFELILVDDGSPDRCGEICDEFAKQDERIRVIHQENGGVSKARNAGLVFSKGEWICFVDADDLITPNYLNIFIKHTSWRIDILQQNSMHLDETLRLKKKSKKCTRSEIFTADELIEGKHQYNCVVWGNLFRRSVIFSNRIHFEEDLTNAEDVDFFINTLIHSRMVVLINSHRYIYRINRPGSATYVEKRPDSLLDANRFIRLRLQLYKNRTGYNSISVDLDSMRLIKRAFITYPAIQKYDYSNFSHLICDVRKNEEFRCIYLKNLSAKDIIIYSLIKHSPLYVLFLLHKVFYYISRNNFFKKH